MRRARARAGRGGRQRALGRRGRSRAEIDPSARDCSRAACRTAARCSRTSCTCAIASGVELDKHDAYYFAPQLSDFDLYLFGEGNHYTIYYKLGAHPAELDGLSGTRFAVWAPNAERVSVVGPFNLWDGRKHALQTRGGSGIWELFVPGVGPGTLYKYEIRTRAGTTVLKSDPYGFAMQLRPGTASIVASLDGYEWHDADWIDARKTAPHHLQPINIYEVHPGSWRRDYGREPPVPQLA